MAVGISKLVEKFEAAARSQHACPVCYRGFTATEEDKFVADVSGGGGGRGFVCGDSLVGQ